MRAHLTHHDVANNVRMVRALHTGAVMLVEGDTDLRVYERLIDPTQCQLVPAHGKDNVLGALDILERGRVGGIAAIVDSDFWLLDGVPIPSQNVLVTDGHDLESMLISSKALDKVLGELAAKTKTAHLRKPIRELLLGSALPLGYLRWLAAPSRDNLLLIFRNLNLRVFLDRRTLQADVPRMVHSINSRSGGRIHGEALLCSRIITCVSAGSEDPWHVCSGHDMVHMLWFGLSNTFGNRKGRAATLELVDAMLRIAYEPSDFVVTRLHSSIEAWETRNLPFKILGPNPQQGSC